MAPLKIFRHILGDAKRPLKWQKFQRFPAILCTLMTFITFCDKTFNGPPCQGLLNQKTWMAGGLVGA